VELCNRVKKRQCGQKWSKELTNSSIYKGTLADINESSFNDIKLAHEKVKKNVKSAAPITFTKKE
jgi:hypothetical protein